MEAPAGTAADDADAEHKVKSDSGARGKVKCCQVTGQFQKFVFDAALPLAHMQRS
jgi:hypothetical protein